MALVGATLLNGAAALAASRVWMATAPGDDPLAVTLPLLLALTGLLGLGPLMGVLLQPLRRA